jgi:hypothetical protein
MRHASVGLSVGRAGELTMQYLELVATLSDLIHTFINSGYGQLSSGQKLNAFE